MCHTQIITPFSYFSRLITTLFFITLSALTYAENEAEFTKMMIGTWSTSNTDKESGNIEKTILQFKGDGSYTSRINSSLFGDAKNAMTGKFSLSDGLKNQFTLKIEAQNKDPEMEKSEMVMSFRVSVVDSNTLKDESGNMIHRIK